MTKINWTRDTQRQKLSNAIANSKTPETVLAIEAAKAARNRARKERRRERKGA